MGKLRLGGRGTCPRTHSKLEVDWPAWPVLSRADSGVGCWRRCNVEFDAQVSGHEEMAGAVEAGSLCQVPGSILGPVTYTLFKPHSVPAKEVLSHFTGEGDCEQVTSLGSHQQKGEAQTCIFGTWGQGAEGDGWEHLLGAQTLGRVRHCSVSLEWSWAPPGCCHGPQR